MDRYYTNLAVLIVAAILVAQLVAIPTSFQKAKAILGADVWKTNRAPIATSGNNVYVTWWDNKTGDWEVMFKASSDGGKTFGNKIDLSNTLGVVSYNASIAAEGNNVYVSWWERNQTSNEPVLRVSNDNGKTFGNLIELSSSSGGNNTSSNKS